MFDVENLNPGAFQNIDEGFHILSLSDFYYQLVGGLFIYAEQPGLSMMFNDLDTAQSVYQRGNTFQIEIGKPDLRDSCEIAHKINSGSRFPFLAIDMQSDLITSGEVPLAHYNSDSKYVWEEFNTLCNISSSDEMNSCRDNLLLGASCAGYVKPYDTRTGMHYRDDETFMSYNSAYDNPINALEIVKFINHMLSYDKPNLFYADLHDNICYRSIGKGVDEVPGDDEHSFTSYSATASNNNWMGSVYHQWRGNYRLSNISEAGFLL